MISMFLLLRGVGGILLVLLGLYVALLRPRRRENVAFATFCALAGLGFGSWLMSPTDSAARALVLAFGGLLFAAAGFALASVAMAFPRPLEPHERVLARKATIVSIVIGVVQGAAYVMRNLTDPGFTISAVRMGALVEDLGLTAFRTAAWLGALLAALRFANGRNATRADHKALAVFAVALALYPAVHGPYHLLDDNPWDTIIGATASLLLLLVVGVLLRATATTTTGSVARWAAWMLLGASTAQMVHYGIVGLPVSPSAVSIVGMFIILIYSILRHQLLGMDVKLRFAFSKSTIAAAFIAVFFIASEAAQQFFGDQFNSGYLGILAAGLLVFAIAPLSRVADRLAEKAVPVAGGPTPSARSAHEDAYRAAVRLALRGGITRREEFDLAKIAETHGIAPVRALELRDAMERARAEAPE